jgi:lysyl-tRNA synthetase, class II
MKSSTNTLSNIPNMFTTNLLKYHSRRFNSSWILQDANKNRLQKLASVYKTNDLYPSLTTLKQKFDLKSGLNLYNLTDVFNINRDIDNSEDSFWVMGKIMNKRDAGKKAYFYRLQQDNKEIDFVAHWSRLEKFEINPFSSIQEFHEFYNSLKIGDHILARVYKSHNKRGDVIIRPVNAAHILSPRLKDTIDLSQHKDITQLSSRTDKVLISLSKKEHLKHRSNNVDPIIIRAKLYRLIRKYLDEKDFLEVETPLLNLKSGGANAHPFSTIQGKEVNEKDSNNLQLRIAPELWLKRLIIAGYDKVYELGKNFRNEGVDITHNPEFSSLELYQKYNDLEDMIALGENLLKEIFIKFESEIDPELYHNFKVKNSYKFKRVDCMEQLSKDFEIELNDLVEVFKHAFENNDTIKLLELLANNKKSYPKDISIQKLITSLIDDLESKYCSSNEPIILINHPSIISPLAKHDITNTRAYRYELFINGIEYMNAYEEQNDPYLQKNALIQQQNMKDNQNEIMSMDDKYCDTMQYGLGPTGGLGVGIDRLMMLLCKEHSIDSVLSFGNLENVKKQ